VTIYGRVILALLPRILNLISNDKALVLRLAAKWGLERRGFAKWLGYGLLQGYAFAWVGHFFVEKNRPATFKVSEMLGTKGDEADMM
jgi:hypothetical protein